MWGVGRFTHMEEFVARSRALGFRCIELNHQVTEALLDEILEIYRQGNVVISSVHDPCPNSSPALHLLPKVSDVDESVRRTGVQTAKNTIDLAHRVGAAFVVLHLGDVTELRGQAERLRVLFQESLGASADYRAALATFKQGFADFQQPHLDAVARSLEDLLPYARERGVRLGLENRYYVNEIPNLPQAEWLLQRFTDGAAGYWHDVGHAEVQQRMGFSAHREWLETLGGRILGIHIHDVLPASITDHQAAGMGSVDLGMALAYLPAAAQRVCEFDRRMSEDQVAAGLRRLKELGFVSA
jgi:sugar phosphate isomerase/epimerase